MFVCASIFSPESLANLWQALNSIDPYWALAVVFAVLFLAGCGLPLPEDIPLTFTGILLGLPGTQEAFGGLAGAIGAVVVICYTSILSGDLVAWKLGRRFGRTLTRYVPFRWFLPENRIHRVESWFQRFGNWTVFFGRMVAGIRFVTFVIAGMARMPASRFILFDSLGALVTVPVWLVLGYVLGTHFDQIVQWMSRISTTTWLVLGALAVLIVLWRLAHKGHRATENIQQ